MMYQQGFLQGWGIKGHLSFFVLLIFSKVSTVNMCDLLIGSQFLLPTKLALAQEQGGSLA